VLVILENSLSGSATDEINQCTMVSNFISYSKESHAKVALIRLLSSYNYNRTNKYKMYYEPRIPSKLIALAN